MQYSGFLKPLVDFYSPSRLSQHRSQIKNQNNYEPTKTFDAQGIRPYVQYAYVIPEGNVRSYFVDVQKNVTLAFSFPVVEVRITHR